MSEVIIACEMLRAEVERALEASGSESPVIWLESALHEHPEKLRTAIQSTIDACTEATILLAFGLCGNALHGVGSKTSRIVAPRFADCLNMLLSPEECSGTGLRPGCLYYTDGWFCSRNTLLDQYEEFAVRKGYKKADRVYQSMLKNYDAVNMIDSGGGISPDKAERAQALAAQFGLQYGEIPGSNRILGKLFRREWDSEFVLVEPGHVFKQMDFNHAAKP